MEILLIKKSETSTFNIALCSSDTSRRKIIFCSITLEFYHRFNVSISQMRPKRHTTHNKSILSSSTVFSFAHSSISFSWIKEFRNRNRKTFFRIFFCKICLLFFGVIANHLKHWIAVTLYGIFLSRTVYCSYKHVLWKLTLSRNSAETLFIRIPLLKST